MKHGHTSISNQKSSPEYTSWCAMKKRCYSPKSNRYSNYGGRGITVCDRWLNSFANFFEDMGPKPSLAHTLDRFPDKNGNYEPSNCRWATKDEQTCNMNKIIYVTHNGQSIPLFMLCRQFNIKTPTVYMRLFYYGWDLDKALTTPPQKLSPKKKK